MADLAVWQRTIVDEEGNVIPGAEVEVRREEDDSLATLYADRAGETPLANPLAADMSGFVRFFAQGDAYTITAVGAGSTRTWRFDPTGRLQEFDRVSEALNADGGADIVSARSNLGTFSTVADVQNSHIPPVLDSIRTNGYYAPGDRGGALYKRVSTEPTHGGKIQSADGAWWELASLDRPNVLMFGAVPGQDCTTAFQQAVDFAEDRGGLVVVPTPEGGELYGISELYVRPGVTITGDQEGVFKSFTNATFSLANETCITACLKAIGTVNTPLIYLARQAAIKNLALVDLRQKLTVTTLDEDPNDTQIAIRLGYAGAGPQSGQVVSNITFLGFNEFLDQFIPDNPNTTTPSLGALTLDRIYGMPFRTGVNIVKMADTSWAYNCQFIANSFLALVQGEENRKLIMRTLTRRVTAWKVGLADGFQLFGCQALGVKYFWHSYRDSFPGDSNIGGGFNIVNCPVDVCGVGYRFDRGGNPIGASIVGGQIIPIAILDGEENTAFQINTEATSGGFRLSVSGVSIHTGGVDPRVKDVRDSDILGPDSATPPDYVADLTNTEEATVSFVNCRLRCHNRIPVDMETALDNGNNVTIVSCEGRERDIINFIPASFASGDPTQFTLVGDGQRTAGLKIAHRENLDSETSLRQETTGRTILESPNDIRIRSNDELNKQATLLWDAEGRLYPVTEGSTLGAFGFPFSTAYTEELRIGDEQGGYARLISGDGSPQGVVSAPVGSVYINRTGVGGVILWVKELGGAGDTGWRSVDTSVPA